MTWTTSTAPNPFRSLWNFNPGLVFLNHGSFGACPKAVLDEQSRFRRQMEASPISFMVRDLEPLLDRARTTLAEFVGCRGEDLALVPNVTTGVNAVLRSMRLRPGEQLLTTNHVYNACRNVLVYVADTTGAELVVTDVPFPIRRAEEVVDAVLGRCTSRTRLALIDHVTSPSGLVFPVETLVDALERRGVETLIDGAHAPGMVPLGLDRLRATYYVGNCHKWLCCPKGAGFLYVRPEKQPLVRPHVISHGANSPRTDRSRFLLEFDWAGTLDPTPYLCIPKAIEHVGGMLPGGWTEIMRQNHAKAIRARDLLCAALGVSAPCPEEMLGAMAALPLPQAARASLSSNELHDLLFDRDHIEVVIQDFPEAGRPCLRISAMLYNRDDEYQALAAALNAIFAR